MLLSIAFMSTFSLVFSASVSKSIFDERTSRYVTIFGDNGKIEVIDTYSPIPIVEVENSEITLHLYTRRNRLISEDLELDVDQVVRSSYFNKNRINVFSIHGWTNDKYHYMNMNVRDAYLEVVDANIFVVDWSGPASGSYLTASNSVQQVGKHVGKFILNLQRILNLKSEHFIVIGFSLGAHVAGNVGRAANGNVDSLIALDPAGPLFYIIHDDKTLRSSDGEFVQVMHTNAGIQGHLEDLGDADYRPNGGTAQAGCGYDVSGSCAHHRAHAYFTESVVSGGFTSRKCSFHFIFNAGACSQNEKSYMGGFPIDKRASGRYYLNTNEEFPYSQS